jgi:hypothetical protein
MLQNSAQTKYLRIFFLSVIRMMKIRKPYLKKNTASSVADIYTIGLPANEKWPPPKIMLLISEYPG